MIAAAVSLAMAQAQQISSDLLSQLRVRYIGPVARLRLLLGKEVADSNALLRQRNVPNVVSGTQ